MVIINGEKTNSDGMTVLEFIENDGRKPEQVAVMIGGEILPKSKYSETVMKDGDEVEIIGFVGGG